VIIHITQGLADRFNLKMADELPKEEKAPALDYLKNRKWDSLISWGAKGFHFRNISCVQMLNFASKLSFFAFNVETGTPEMLGHIMWQYLDEIYSDDEEMKKALEKYFKQNAYTVYTPLTDKAATASLNKNEQIFTNEEKMSQFIENGTLLSRKLNWEYNKGYLVARIVSGKTEFIVPADRFKDLIINRFGKEE